MTIVIVIGGLVWFMYSCNKNDKKRKAKNLKNGITEPKRVGIMQSLVQLDQEQKERKLAKANEPIRCPRCQSTQIAPMKKGFGFGKAIVAGALTGGVGGLLVGSMGRNKVELHCMKCRKKFKA